MVVAADGVFEFLLHHVLGDAGFDLVEGGNLHGAAVVDVEDAVYAVAVDGCGGELAFFQVFDGGVNGRCGFFEVFEGVVFAVDAAVLFGRGVGGVFAGSVGEGFFRFQVFNSLFGIRFFRGHDFAELDLFAAFVVGLHFVVGFAGVGFADGLGLDDVGGEGLVEQLVLEVFPLLVEAGFFVVAGFLRGFAGVFGGGFEFGALVEFQTACFLGNQYAGNGVAEQFVADFGAVGDFGVLCADEFDLAVDFAAVDFGAVYRYQGLRGQAAGEGCDEQCLGNMGFFHGFLALGGSVEKFVGGEGADGKGVDAACFEEAVERFFDHALALKARQALESGADDEDAVVAAACVAGVPRVEVTFVGKFEYVRMQVLQGRLNFLFHARPVI